MRCTLLAIVLLAGCRTGVSIYKSSPAETKPAASKPASEPTEPVHPTWARNDFEALVLGKTQDQVRAALGEPASTGFAQGQEYWAYERLTREPTAGTTDRATTIWWKNHKADRVEY